jgi:ketosteroid isomerase-like protein
MSWRLLLLLLLVQPLALRAQQAPANVESAIRALEEQERVAVLNEDLVALERLWSDRLMVNNPQNAVSPDRATVLDLVRRGLIRYSRFDRQIEAIRVHGDIAIVMGSEVIVRRAEGAAAEPAVDRRYTHVWRQSNGVWQLVARHANIITGR